MAARVEPWVTLTCDALAGALPSPVARRLPLEELAYAVVALSLGLEVLGGLTRDHGRGQAVLARLARGGAGLLSLLTGASGSPGDASSPAG